MEGLYWDQYGFDFTDVTIVKARDKEADVQLALSEISAKVVWVHPGPEGLAINKILANIDVDDLPAQFRAWQNYLMANSSFPFRAEIEEWQPPRSRLRTGDRVRIVGI